MLVALLLMLPLLCLLVVAAPRDGVGESFTHRAVSVVIIAAVQSRGLSFGLGAAVSFPWCHCRSFLLLVPFLGAPLLRAVADTWHRTCCESGLLPILGDYF